MSRCRHKWRWLLRPVIVTIGQVGESYNVECSLCGARAWRHHGETY